MPPQVLACSCDSYAHNPQTMTDISRVALPKTDPGAGVSEEQQAEAVMARRL